MRKPCSYGGLYLPQNLKEAEWSVQRDSKEAFLYLITGDAA